MHPRVRKELIPLTPAEAKTVDVLEGKFEYFRKYCIPCGGNTIHRFTTDDPITIGTCQHEWDVPLAPTYPQETIPLFD